MEGAPSTGGKTQFLGSLDRQGWRKFHVGFFGLAVVSGFVTALETPPPDEPDPTYTRANTLLLGYLCMACSKLMGASQICSKYMPEQNGHGAYQAIKSACVGNSGVESFESLLNLANDLSYRVHDDPMVLLVEHYGLYRSIMDLPEEHRKIELALKVQFLRFLRDGHRENFDFIINTCLDSSVSYGNMYSKVVAQINSETAGEASMQQANYAGKKGNKVPRESRRCFKCNKKGHFARDCPADSESEEERPERGLSAPKEWGELKKQANKADKYKAMLLSYGIEPEASEEEDEALEAETGPTYHNVSW